MSEEIKNKLWRVITTLEDISVRGKDNLDMLLGCILELERMVKEVKETEVNTDGD